MTHVASHPVKPDVDLSAPEAAGLNSLLMIPFSLPIVSMWEQMMHYYYAAQHQLLRNHGLLCEDECLAVSVYKTI